MLRIIFVTSIFIGFAIYALQGAFNALLLYLWIAYFRPEKWVWTKFIQELPISFVAGVYLLVRAVLSGIPFRFNFRTLILLALLILGILSTFNSNYFTYSSIYLMDFGKTVTVTYLISVLATDLKKLRLIILVIGVSLAFESAKQGWAQLILNPGASNVNPLVMFGDNNGVAVGMLMLVPILVALARTATDKRERWVHYFLAVGVLYRGVATYSRGGFLAAAALGLVYAWHSPRRFRALVGGSLAAVLVLSVMPDTFWDRMSTITVEEGERDGSANGRLHFWSVAVLMAQDRPLLGVGLNAYNVAYPAYDPSRGAYGYQRSVHSAWLGILAELGYPGIILFTASVLLAFFAAGRARRLAKKGLISPELGHYGTALEGGLVAFAVGGTFVIFQYVEMLWHVIGLSMAITYLAEEELAKRKKEGPTVRPPLKPIVRQPPPRVFRPQPRPAVASFGRTRP